MKLCLNHVIYINKLQKFFYMYWIIQPFYPKSFSNESFNKKIIEFENKHLIFFVYCVFLKNIQSPFMKLSKNKIDWQITMHKVLSNIIDDILGDPMKLEKIKIANHSQPHMGFFLLVNSKANIKSMYIPHGQSLI